MNKIQTLHLYLDKEKKNLENLKSTNANRQDILRAENTIRTLQEQLQLLCVEVNKQFYWIPGVNLKLNIFVHVNGRTKL